MCTVASFTVTKVHNYPRLPVYLPLSIPLLSLPIPVRPCNYWCDIAIRQKPRHLLLQYLTFLLMPQREALKDERNLIMVLCLSEQRNCVVASYVAYFMR